MLLGTPGMIRESWPCGTAVAECGEAVWSQLRPDAAAGLTDDDVARGGVDAAEVAEAQRVAEEQATLD